MHYLAYSQTESTFRHMSGRDVYYLRQLLGASSRHGHVKKKTGASTCLPPRGLALLGGTRQRSSNERNFDDQSEKEKKKHQNDNHWSPKLREAAAAVVSLECRWPTAACPGALPPNKPALPPFRKPRPRLPFCLFGWVFLKVSKSWCQN